MAEIVIWGAGRVGRGIAADLCRDGQHELTVVDASETALEQVRDRCEGELRTRCADLSDPAAARASAAEHDLVIGALASRLGMTALRAVIDAGRPYCDISFMEEDPLELDRAAREAGITAVVDCGVAPGLSHMLAQRSVDDLDRADRVTIYVGGVPRERRWPFEYKAGFAPRDVVAEYTRPVHLREHGRETVRPALASRELIDVEGIGTMEAFLTDGLRTLVRSLEVPNLAEKTLRYPGHAELMAVFREAGFFDEQPRRVGEVSVRPIDLFSELVFPLWSYRPGEADLTVMKVAVEGERRGAAVRDEWHLYDAYDPHTDTTSMARSTAYPCTAVARLLLDEQVPGPGVIPPERIAENPARLERVLTSLRERGVRIGRRETNPAE
jgi:saccharopine dehydrogenase-like NADP-dependent oxidoreductase